MALWKGAGVKLLMKDRWSRALCSRSEVGVFWDLNKCGVEDVEMGEGKADAIEDASHIVPNIVKVLRSSGFLGPISMRAYGNTRAFSNHRVTQALLATGVDLHHVPGGMNDLWKHLILDLLLWVRENSSPAHVLLISGNKEYSSVLHKLHMRGYDVLLAHPEGDMSRNLLSAASKVWIWDKMIRGTEVSTLQSTPNILRHSYRSHNSDKSQCSHTQEVQPEPDVKHDFMCHDSKRKSQNIPKEVVDQVLDIIRSRPSGFTVSAFRRQLARSNIILDKDFYGHKDVLSFLLSIPNLKARLIWTTDKTRAFHFTEDLDASPTLNDDRKEALSTRSDHSKYAKQEMLKADEPEKRDSGIKVKNAFCNNTSAKESCSKGSIAGVDSSSVNNAAKSPGFFACGTKALLAVWNKTLSKLIALKKYVPEASGRENSFMNLSSPIKGDESKLKNEDINGELLISSVSSPTPEKKGDILHKKKLTQTTELDVHNAIHEAVVGGQEYGKSQCLRKSNVSASFDSVGNWQTVCGRNSESKAQGRHCGLQNELKVTSPLLNEAKVSIMDARLTNEMCEDVLWYLSNEGSTLFTRSVTGMLANRGNIIWRKGLKRSHGSILPGFSAGFSKGHHLDHQIQELNQELETVFGSSANHELASPVGNVMSSFTSSSSGLHESMAYSPRKAPCRSSNGLTHVDAHGKVAMVNVSDKSPSIRVAIASGKVLLGSEAFPLVSANQIAKGDVLTVAKIAGISGAKQTGSLIPLCHNITLSNVELKLELDEREKSVLIKAEATAVGVTGVEMEALTAVSVAALTIYDMCKAVSKHITITDIQLESKTGGKSGNWCRSQ